MGRPVVHFEVIGSDGERTRSYYSALFGWKTKVGQGAGFPYTHWQNDGADIGGMMAIMEQMGPMPPCWVNYVQVANCDETAAKVRQAGGEVLALKTDVTREQSTRAMAEETV